MIKPLVLIISFILLSGASYVNDQDPPVLSNIQISPEEITRQTEIITVTLNATDESGIKYLKLEVCSEALCYKFIEMNQLNSGLWNASVNVSSFINQIDVLYLKVMASDTVNNVESYDIGIYYLTETLQDTSDSVNDSTEPNYEKSGGFDIFATSSLLFIYPVMRRIKKKK